MTGLTSKGMATRQRIIDGAAAVIRDLGVTATTLDDICSRTATSKGQVFHYFPNGRDELLLAVARHEADRVLSDQQPHLSSLTTWESWRRWRDVVVRRYRRQGRTCPMAILMTELVHNDPAAQEVTRTLFLRWRAELAAGVRAMQANGTADADLDADSYAGALVAAIQGGVAILLATGSSRELEAALDLILERLLPSEAIAPRPEMPSASSTPSAMGAGLTARAGAG